MSGRYSNRFSAAAWLVVLLNTTFAIAATDIVKSDAVPSSSNVTSLVDLNLDGSNQWRADLAMANRQFGSAAGRSTNDQDQAMFSKPSASVPLPSEARASIAVLVIMFVTRHVRASSRFFTS